MSQIKWLSQAEHEKVWPRKRYEDALNPLFCGRDQEICLGFWENKKGVLIWTIAEAACFMICLVDILEQEDQHPLSRLDLTEGPLARYRLGGGTAQIPFHYREDVLELISEALHHACKLPEKISAESRRSPPLRANHQLIMAPG